MKTIQKFAVFAAILAMVGFAKADALYWQVDNSSADASYKGDYSYAALYDSTTGAMLDGYYESEGGKVAPALSDLGDGSSTHSFYIELYNASFDSVYKTESISYTDLAASGYISTGGVSVPTYTATSGFNGASVPEPTSGVLLLIGGAMLALRRRRRA